MFERNRNFCFSGMALSWYQCYSGLSCCTAESLALAWIFYMDLKGYLEIEGVLTTDLGFAAKECASALSRNAASELQPLVK